MTLLAPHGDSDDTVSFPPLGYHSELGLLLSQAQSCGDQLALSMRNTNMAGNHALRMLQHMLDEHASVIRFMLIKKPPIRFDGSSSDSSATGAAAAGYASMGACAFSAPVRCVLPAEQLCDVVRSLIQGSSHGFRLVLQDMYYNASRPDHHCMFYPEVAADSSSVKKRWSFTRSTLLIADDAPGCYQARPMKAIIPDVIRKACGALLARLEDDDLQAFVERHARVPSTAYEALQTDLFAVITYNNAQTTPEHRKIMKKLYAAFEAEATSCLTDPRNNNLVQASWLPLLLDKV